MLDDITRFFAKIGTDPEECWIWTGAKNSKGYGQATYRGKVIYSHRLIWILLFGSIPDELEVCHKCDNPSCVRPNHLFSGTRSDNMSDAGRKGHMARDTKGSKHPMTNLTETKVVEIRRRYALGGVTYRELAFEYDTGWTTIQKIITRKTWQHV